MSVIKVKIWDKDFQEKVKQKPSEEIEFTGEDAFKKLYLYWIEKYGLNGDDQ